jgi:hypothetical protein
MIREMTAHTQHAEELEPIVLKRFLMSDRPLNHKLMLEKRRAMEFMENTKKKLMTVLKSDIAAE